MTAIAKLEELYGERDMRARQLHDSGTLSIRNCRGVITGSMK